MVRVLACLVGAVSTRPWVGCWTTCGPAGASCSCYGEPRVGETALLDHLARTSSGYGVVVARRMLAESVALVFTTRESSENPVTGRAALQRQRGKLKRGDPPFGASLQRCDVVCREYQFHRAVGYAAASSDVKRRSAARISTSSPRPRTAPPGIAGSARLAITKVHLWG